MGVFFRKGTERELKNAREGMVMGFVAALLLLVANNTSQLINNEDILSSQTILISILIISWGYEWYLNKRNKKKED